MIIVGCDEYELIKTAGLLRLLLLDAYPLIDKIGRRTRTKVKFAINDRPEFPPMPGLAFYSIEDGLDPDSARCPKRIEVTKEQLLKRRIILVENRPYTVRDLILHVAHIQGGIHAGDPKDQKEEALREMAEIYSIGGVSAGIRMLSVIGRIVRNGLEPLRLAISGRRI